MARGPLQVLQVAHGIWPCSQHGAYLACARVVQVVWRNVSMFDDSLQLRFGLVCSMGGTVQVGKCQKPQRGQKPFVQHQSCLDSS